MLESGSSIKIQRYNGERRHVSFRMATQEVFGSRKGKVKKARVDEDPLVQQTLQLQQQQQEQAALQSEQVTYNDEITNSQKLAWDVLDGSEENSQSHLSQ